MCNVIIIVNILLIICCVINYFLRKKSKNDLLTDQLTGMYNRKILPTVKEKESKGFKYSVIMCDIDHFKRINDTYGHGVGDLVLSTVSEAIRTSFKEKLDFVIRYGGEEFLVFILNNKEESEFLIDRAEKLRAKVEALEILTKDMTLIKITISLGLHINIKGDTMDRVEIADQKLYEAKTTGRNKVVYNDLIDK